jgi:hypothetical protein
MHYVSKPAITAASGALVMPTDVHGWRRRTVVRWISVSMDNAVVVLASVVGAHHDTPKSVNRRFHVTTHTRSTF